MVGRDKTHKPRERSTQGKSTGNGNNNNANNDEHGNDNGHANGTADENFDESNPLHGSNIETQFQNQIQSQLQNQLQNELNQTFETHQGEETADDNGAPSVNILDSTNIDDELRNLEQLDINNLAKSAVDAAAAAAVSFAQAATANDEDDEDDDVDVNVVNEIAANIGDKRKISDDKDNDDPSSLLRGYKFWLPILSEENENVKTMIVSLGGEIVDSDGPYVVPLIPSRDKFKPDLQKQFYYNYIYDTYMKKKNVPLNKYHAYKLGSKNFKINIGDYPFIEKLPIEDDDEEVHDIEEKEDTAEADSAKFSKKKQSKEIDPSKAKKKSNKFTKAEDDFILDLVRRNPHLRSTHTFFSSIAQLKPLCEHTGNSIRYRYRKVLSAKLDYVYKINPETCKPELDPETNKPIEIKEIPSLIKSQYTAEEDLQLCKHILAYKNGEMIVDSKRKYEITQIPEYVFQELYKTNSRHSIMSWRDRYRKFAAKYGLRKYIGYYERCLERDVEPQPMKNMSSRKDRKDYKVDTFGNETEQRTVKKSKSEDKVVSKAKSDSADKVTDVSKSTELADKATEGGKDNEDAYVASNLDAAKGALEALANLSAKQVKAIDEEGTVDKTGKENNKEDVDEEAIKNISQVRKIADTVDSATNDDSANLFVDATEDEMKQYDIALHNSELEDANSSTDKKDEENGSAHIPDDEADNDVELVDAKADDGLMDFRQLIDIDPEPLKHRDNIDLSTMISNIRECFRNFGDRNTPYELFKDISDQTGISMLWLNYWFDCSCGMLGTFIQAIINYLKTGELVMNGVSGFWTEKDDELLKVDPNNKELLELHGRDSVTKRKAVLFRYV